MRKIKKPELPVLAIDLGGTKLLSAIISPAGEVLAREYCFVFADEGPQSVIERIFSSINSILWQISIEPSQLNSISIAAAGAIDTEKGLVTSSPHLPGWHNIPLRDMVKEKYSVNTYLINDASAAVLGEHHFGAGQGINNLILLTIGTGIGGGIIIDGKLYSGTNGTAGEIGHMTISTNGPKCTCGNVGCLEMLVSGKAIARETIKRIRQGEKSSLVNVNDITAEEVLKAAQDGDFLASKVIFKAATCLGIGMVNIVNIFNPEMIIIGGGAANMGNLLINPAKQIVREKAFQLPANTVQIVPAQLGNDAGVFGAAIFAFQQNLKRGE
ncbi:MAG: ROK family protein [Dehalococcoidales bacterium]|nr:ROK family protein [Dehalococcoidales bacterium]